MPQPGLYQPRPARPSNASTKLSRYRISGTSHRNGTEATFCEMCAVAPSRITTPSADSPNHASGALAPTATLTPGSSPKPSSWPSPASREKEPFGSPGVGTTVVRQASQAALEQASANTA